MLIDGFMFYNELDMLEYRLSVLYDVVDCFIITEATLTHTGNPKPLFYEENKERFKQFSNKIIHVVVDDLIPKQLNANLSEKELFQNENYHRDCINKGIARLDNSNPLKNDDIIHISDADEIPSPDVLKTLKSNPRILSTLFCLQQDLYYYNLHTKVECFWASAKIMSYNHYKFEMKSSPQKCRMTPGPVISNAGWHLSYFGDKEFIRTKIQSICEQNYNTPENTDLNNIQRHIDDGDDIYGRKGEKCTRISIEANKNLPPRCRELLKKYL